MSSVPGNTPPFDPQTRFSSLVTAMDFLAPKKASEIDAPLPGDKLKKSEPKGKIDFKDGQFAIVTKKPSSDLSKVVETISQTISFDKLEASSAELEKIKLGCDALAQKVLQESKGGLNPLFIMIMMALGFTPSSVKTQLALNNIHDQIDRKLKITKLTESITTNESRLEKLQNDLKSLQEAQKTGDKIKEKANTLKSGVKVAVNLIRKEVSSRLSGKSSVVQNEVQEKAHLTPINNLKEEIKTLEETIASQKAELELAKKPLSTNESLAFKRAVLFGVGLGQKNTLNDVLKTLNLDRAELAKRAGMKEDDTVGSTIEKNIGYLKDLQVQIPQEPGAQKLMQETLERSDRILNPKKKVADFGLAITNELQQMKDGDFLFVPVGCKNHDTLMVFKKLGDGTVETTYYNTGLGSEKLAASGFKSFFLGSTGVKFEPIQPNNLTLYLNQLHKTANNPDMTQLNALLFGDNAVLKKPESIQTSRSQIEGTCSFSSLLLGIEEVIETKTKSETAMKSFERDLHYRVSQDVANSLEKKYKPEGNKIIYQEVLVTEHLLDLHNSTFLKGISPPKPKYRIGKSNTALEDLQETGLIPK